MSKYKFDWSNFTKENFVDYCAQMENGKLYADDYIGCVRVGELCFDLVLRLYEEDKNGNWNDNDNLTLTYDLYVGGVVGDWNPSGEPYAYSRIEPGYPYDYAEGGDFDDSCISMTYEDFVKLAEDSFAEYIETSRYYNAPNLLREKAEAPLHIW